MYEHKTHCNAITGRHLCASMLFHQPCLSTCYGAGTGDAREHSRSPVRSPAPEQGVTILGDPGWAWDGVQCCESAGNRGALAPHWLSVVYFEEMRFGPTQRQGRGASLHSPERSAHRGPQDLPICVKTEQGSVTFQCINSTKLVKTSECLSRTQHCLDTRESGGTGPGPCSKEEYF